MGERLFGDLPPVYRSVDGDVFLGNMGVIQTPGDVPEPEIFDHFPLDAMRLNLVQRARMRARRLMADSLSQGWWETALVLLDSGDVDQLARLLQLGATELDGRFKDVLNWPSYRGMTLLHYAVILHNQDALSEPIIDLLLKAGAVDVEDDWGASAQSRAAQLGKSFCERFFPEWGYPGAVFYDKSGKAHDAPTKATFKSAAETYYGRKDLRLHKGIVEHEVLLYLLLFMPKDFDVSLFNAQQLERAQAAFGVVPEWDDMPDPLVVANHGHLSFGEDSLGLFAGAQMVPGQMVSVMSGYTELCVKNDLDVTEDVDAVLDSYVSPYAFYLFPLESVLVNYHGVLLVPLINCFPEFGPGPMMFFNDSGSQDTNNVAWMTYFVDGLPALWFFATRQVAKGEELFGGYMVGSELWARKRGVKMDQFAAISHPHIK